MYCIPYMLLFTNSEVIAKMCFRMYVLQTLRQLQKAIAVLYVDVVVPPATHCMRGGHYHSSGGGSLLPPPM